MSATFALRVGSEYPSRKYPKSQYARVTSVEEGNVIFERLRRDGEEHVFPMGSLRVGSFCACYTDERPPISCPKCKELAKLLLEARDALPAISLASARLRGIDLSLADRIETALEPWRVKEEEVAR